jgi:uncharacterized damage-inducible protein DinB
MTVKHLTEMFDYGYWANRKLFEVVSKLTPEQFLQPVAGSYGSVRNTLVHMLSAEWGWLSRCGGPQRGDTLKADDYPTFDSVLRLWTKVEGYMRQFLSELEGEDLKRNVEFALPQNEKRSMALGEVMQHAAVHGIHHRGQVALLLRQLGYVPGNFDMLFYYGDRRGRSAQARSNN